MIIVLSSVELESEGKVFFEINLVCGERDPVPAEEFEHAQWAPTVGATGARSPSEKRGGGHRM